jgi:hypothetical protein
MARERTRAYRPASTNSGGVSHWLLVPSPASSQRSMSRTPRLRLARTRTCTEPLGIPSSVDWSWDLLECELAIASDWLTYHGAAIEVGKHVLSEKPVANTYRECGAWQIWPGPGLKTKVGLTFRYSLAVRYMKDRIAQATWARPSSTTPRAELAVAQPADPVVPQLSGQRRYDQGGLARRLRATRYRHRPPVHGLGPDRGRRRVAQLRPG